MAERIGVVTIVVTDTRTNDGETMVNTADLVAIENEDSDFPKLIVRDEAGDEFYLLVEKES